MENATSHLEYSNDLNDWVTIGILSLFFLIGAPVNLSIFFTLSERWTNLSPKERLKLQLILSDLMILFIYAVSKVCWHLSFTWRGGLMLCKIVKFGHELSFQFSSAILASIGLERMSNVLAPFPNPFQIGRRVRVLIVTSWLYAIAFSSPQLYKFDLIQMPDSDQFQCTSRYRILQANDQLTASDNSLRQTLSIVHLLTVFWIPLGLMLVSYSVISSYIFKLYRITRPGYSLPSESTTAFNRQRSSWRYWIRKGSDGASHILSKPFRHPNNVSFNMTKETVVIGEGGELVRTGAERVEEEKLWPASPQGSARPARSILPLRTMKITLILMSTYIICWTPYHVTAIV